MSPDNDQNSPNNSADVMTGENYDAKLKSALNSRHRRCMARYDPD